MVQESSATTLNGVKSMPDVTNNTMFKANAKAPNLRGIILNHLKNGSETNISQGVDSSSLISQPAQGSEDSCQPRSLKLVLSWIF